jgi:two-component system, NtrC family, response regulator AtoC
MTEARPRILIADDDPSIRNLLTEFLQGEDFRVAEASNGQEVLQQMEADRPDAVLMDIRMPELDGLSVLQRTQSDDNRVPIILMTAYGTSNLAIRAMQLGAYDYITKPFDLDDVLMTLKRLFERETLAKEVRDLRGRLGKADPSEKIVGNSAPMQAVYKTIGIVAGSDATVLITGETGTGKELVAQVLHQTSTFSQGPLIKVNCAALPETLLESELFGHEKGSFTGAINQRKGRFELAHKGSIFLDEVGEMSLGTQKKLLRVLQEREFERVGGTSTVKVDTRVITATNKILSEEVAAGRFREDLYYRLNVISIHMPPLRERKDDIPLLVEYFLDKFRYTQSSPAARISEEALQALEKHAWPGNVRELENSIERAVIMSQGGVITSRYLQLSPVNVRRTVDVRSLVRDRVSLQSAASTFEKQILEEALDQSKGDLDEAAVILGLDRSSLISKLAERNIKHREQSLNLA